MDVTHTGTEGTFARSRVAAIQVGTAIVYMQQPKRHATRERDM